MPDPSPSGTSTVSGSLHPAPSIAAHTASVATPQFLIPRPAIAATSYPMIYLLDSFLSFPDDNAESGIRWFYGAKRCDRGRHRGNERSRADARVPRPEEDRGAR